MNNDIKHSIDFITSKTGGKSGFTVPKNYFNDFEEECFVKLSESEMPKKESFKVPSDYFANLEDEIIAKVSSEEKTTKVNSLRQRVRRVIPYASVASVLLFVSIYFFNNYNTTVNFDDITVADIENWYDNNYDATNNTELAMVLETSDFEDTDLTTINIDDTSLENYFNNNDNSSLFNEIQ